MNPTPFKNFGWSVEDIASDPADQLGLLDITAQVQVARIEDPTGLTPRLWEALGGGALEGGDERSKELCWCLSFALAGLTRLSEEFRPFARVVRFRIGPKESARIPCDVVVCAVRYRSVLLGTRIALLLEDEL